MAPSETRIDDLRRRVIEEPGSRAFVLLAEEYRRDGRLGEALSTLEAGLAVQPDYLAARIALGRGQLEAHLVDQGIRTLERVVRADKTQMVAYRLLVGAHAERGDSASAQHALSEYALLNPQDPELQFLTDVAATSGAPQSGGDPSETHRPPPDSEPTAAAVVAPEETEVAPEEAEVVLEEPEADSAEQSPEPSQPPFSLAPPEVVAHELGSLEPRPLHRPRAPGGAEDEDASPQLASEPQESRQSSAEPRATATLAELYLRQGHTEEAAEIYRRILIDEPDSPIARAALDALTQDTFTALAAAKLELYRSYAAKLATLREERDARA